MTTLRPVRCDQCGEICNYADEMGPAHAGRLCGCNQERAMETLRQIQEQHRQFVIDMGWAHSKTPLECTALICEEIGELTHELRQNHPDYDAVGDELADIILRTIDLAGECGVDIQVAVVAKVKKNIANIDAMRARGRRI